MPIRRSRAKDHAQPYVNVCHRRPARRQADTARLRDISAHPRTLARELGILTLEEAVRKMSGLAAEHFPASPTLGESKTARARDLSSSILIKCLIGRPSKIQGSIPQASSM